MPSASESLTVSDFVGAGIGLVTVLVSTDAPLLILPEAVLSTLPAASAFTLTANVAVTVAPAGTLSLVQVMVPFSSVPAWPSASPTFEAAAGATAASST